MYDGPVACFVEFSDAFGGKDSSAHAASEISCRRRVGRLASDGPVLRSLCLVD